ncbi:MAG: hypothetical protein K2W79_00550 [Hydrotalea flava]|nr:hypothetical protein [Hydrotalea flava]
MKKNHCCVTLLFFAFIAIFSSSYGQSNKNPEPSAPANHVVKGYFSFIIPWVTLSKEGTTTEFEKYTNIGFPVGINIYYNQRFGISYEITPLVQWYKSEGSAPFSKTNNLLIDPGIIFRGNHGFNFVPRLAFETQGRYGFTPVFNKVYLQTKDVDYWFSISFPTRFGNNAPASVGGNLQVGFTFN